MPKQPPNAYYLHEKPWLITPSLHYPNKTATVIGGGLAGTSIAYFLSLKGWKITLIERHTEIAKEASANPAAVFRPLIGSLQNPLHQLMAHAFDFTMQHYQQLQKEGLTVYPYGVLHLLDDASHHTTKQHSSIAYLSKEQASHIAGVPLDSSAYWIEQAGWLSPKELAALYVTLARPNMHLLLEQTAIHLQKTAQKWHILNDKQQLLAESDVVILANAHDVKIFPETQFIPVRPIRGQVNYIAANDHSRKLQTVLTGNGVLFPATQDRHLVGASFLVDQLHTGLTDHEARHNKEVARRLLPNAWPEHGLLKEGWFSIRAASPDRMPFVGMVANTTSHQQQYATLHYGNQRSLYQAADYHHGLYISAVYGSRGVTTIPYCSHMLAKLITEEPLTDHEQTIRHQLNPVRFLIKQLSKPQGNN